MPGHCPVRSANYGTRLDQMEGKGPPVLDELKVNKVYICRFINGLTFWQWTSSWPAYFHKAYVVTAMLFIITEICAELLLARWAPHFDYNSPAGNLGSVAWSNDPWRCRLAGPSMGSWINSAGVLPHFAEDDPSPEALEGDRLVRQWIT